MAAFEERSCVIVSKTVGFVDAGRVFKTDNSFMEYHNYIYDVNR